MKLRYRVMAVVCIVAVAPVVTLGLLLRADAIRQANREYDQQLDVAVATARQRVTERRERERRALERLCRADFLVDRLLLDMQAGRFGPSEHGDLVERLPGVMRSMGLDALSLLDARAEPTYGNVLAAGHFPGRAGSSEPVLARSVEEAGERWFVHDVHVRREGRTYDARAVLTGCVAERGAARIIAVGGQVLDEELIAALAADVPPLRLTLAPEPPPDGVQGRRREVWVFEDLAGRPAARLVATIDDEPLQARLRAIERQMVYTAGATFAIALLVGILLSVAISRPLAELQSAASRVASGDMSSMITVRRQDEVGRALGAFNHMTEQLRHARARLIRAERIAAWRDIARRIAHEIKNPLMPIQTSIETMRKTHARKHPEFDEIFEESTATILEEVERLKHIVTEFSRFARLPRPQPAPLRVEDVVHHVVGLHSSGEVAVSVDQRGELPEIRADREQLTQVLVNLVQNAADAARARHGSRGGRVEVQISPNEEGVRLAVVDNGVGVPPEERERIFEPYYTTKSTGTGLGLAIVHRILSDHGGSIDVEDGLDGGAAFVVTLTTRGPPTEVEGSQSEAAVPLTRPRR